MSTRRALWPKQPRNFAATAVLAVAMVFVYLVASRFGWPWSPKRGVGLLFGFLAAFLFLFEAVYPLRRPGLARPFPNARAWLQAHVYLGWLAFVAVLVHSGFVLPSGWMGFWLLGLSTWVTLTGMVGVFLQKWIPAISSDGLRVTALYERIPELLEALRYEAETLMEDAGEALDNFYRTQVAEPLSKLQPSWAYVVDVRRGRNRAVEPFQRMAQFVDPEEKQKLDDLLAIYLEKLELDATYSVQRALRVWLTWTLHVPAAGLLLGLLLIHIGTWMLY